MTADSSYVRMELYRTPELQIPRSSSPRKTRLRTAWDDNKLENGTARLKPRRFKNVVRPAQTATCLPPPSTCPLRSARCLLLGPLFHPIIHRLIPELRVLRLQHPVAFV